MIFVQHLLIYMSILSQQNKKKEDENKHNFIVTRTNKGPLSETKKAILLVQKNSKLL